MWKEGSLATVKYGPGEWIIIIMEGFLSSMYVLLYLLININFIVC